MKRRFYTTHEKLHSVLEQVLDEEGNILRDRFWCGYKDAKPQPWNNDPTMRVAVIDVSRGAYAEIMLCRAKKYIRELGGEYRVD